MFKPGCSTAPRATSSWSGPEKVDSYIFLDSSYTKGLREPTWSVGHSYFTLKNSTV